MQVHNVRTCSYNCYPHSLVVLDLVVPLGVLDPIVPLDVLDSLVPLDVLDLTVLLVGEAVIEEHTIPEPTQDKKETRRFIRLGTSNATGQDYQVKCM